MKKEIIRQLMSILIRGLLSHPNRELRLSVKPLTIRPMTNVHDPFHHGATLKFQEQTLATIHAVQEHLLVVCHLAIHLNPITIVHGTSLT